MKKGVLRNLTKFTGKHLCQSLFFNKVAGLGPATLLKKRLWHRYFSVNYAKFSRTPSLQKHLLVTASLKKVISKYIQGIPSIFQSKITVINLGCATIFTFNLFIKWIALNKMEPQPSVKYFIICLHHFLRKSI